MALQSEASAVLYEQEGCMQHSGWVSPACGSTTRIAGTAVVHAAHAHLNTSKKHRGSKEARNNHHRLQGTRTSDKQQRHHLGPLRTTPVCVCTCVFWGQLAGWYAGHAFRGRDALSHLNCVFPVARELTSKQCQCSAWWAHTSLTQQQKHTHTHTPSLLPPKQQHITVHGH